MEETNQLEKELSEIPFKLNNPEEYLNDCLGDRSWCVMYAGSYSNPDMEKAREQSMKEYNEMQKINNFYLENKEEFMKKVVEKVKSKKYYDEDVLIIETYRELSKTTN